MDYNTRRYLEHTHYQSSFIVEYEIAPMTINFVIINNNKNTYDIINRSFLKYLDKVVPF
jgi:hypothetical protein